MSIHKIEYIDIPRNDYDDGNEQRVKVNDVEAKKTYLFKPFEGIDRGFHAQSLNKINNILRNYGRIIEKKDGWETGSTVSTYEISDSDYQNRLLTELAMRERNYRSNSGGSRRARRPSRKYKKSAKRVFRKKSRSTRRR